MRYSLLPMLSLALASCGRPPEPPADDPDPVPDTAVDTDTDDTPTDTSTTPPLVECPDGSTPTDTFPQFCGDVPRNLIFVSIDTLRKDQLTRYGTEDLSPFLDSLMQQGVVLDDHAQCSNWTYESVTCTMLGRQGYEAGFVARLSTAYRAPVPDTPMLGTWMQELGFHNILISANGWLGGDWNNDQGFAFSKKSGPRVRHVWEDAHEQLQAAIDAGDAERWFLHMHMLDPHVPYNAPDEYNIGLDALDPLPFDVHNSEAHYDTLDLWPDMTPDEKALLEQHLRVLYAGEIRYTDAELKVMFEDLDARGWLDDALVVFWSDHGEAFWEHGAATHAHWLFGEENDGLAFFWAKNIVPAAWKGPTSAVDIAPTVLGLYGMPMPPEITGVPLGQAPANRYRHGVAVARKGSVQMVRRGPYRMQFRWGTGDLILTDVVSDPQEKINLVADEPDVALELWEQLLPRIKLLEPLASDREIVWPEGFPTE